MADYAKLLDAALHAVTDACAVCRQVQSNMDRVRAIVKDDNSPVTVADFASQAVVGHALKQRLGEVVLVGEETSAFLRNPEHAVELQATIAAAREVWTDADEQSLINAVDLGAAAPNPRGFWTLDPIDGTKGFLRGQQYAVSLAYIERGVPVVGVLGCPNLPRDFSADLDQRDPHGCLYFAIAGDASGGLFESPAAGPKETPIQVRRLERDPSAPLAITASVEKAHSSVSDTDRIMALVDPRHELVQVDSQCKYALVARGQADAYLRLPTRKDYVERIWDHAAGALVAEEAGCAVTDIDGKPLDFSKGRGLEANRGIVCAPPGVHGRIMGAIRQLGLSKN